MSLYQFENLPSYILISPDKHLLVKTGGFGVVTIILGGRFVVGGKGGLVVARGVGLVTGVGGFVVTGGG